MLFLDSDSIFRCSGVLVRSAQMLACTRLKNSIRSAKPFEALERLGATSATNAGCVCSLLTLTWLGLHACAAAQACS